MLDGCVHWPPELAARYRELGYWRDETLGQSLREWADRYGDRVALVDGSRTWTYRQLDVTADRMAHGLRGIGIGRGDRVVVHLPNVGEFVPLLFALFRLGALPVLALPPHRQVEIAYLCEFAEAVAYVIPRHHGGFDYSTLAAAVDVPHVLYVDSLPLADGSPFDDADPSDVAMFLLSGGTTGLPKLIPRTHNDYAYNLRTSAAVCGFDAETVYLAALPLAHNFPLGCPGALGTFHVGGKVVLAASASPDFAFPLVEREHVTATALVPPLALLWLDGAEFADEDLSSLRVLQVGGARFMPEAASRVRPVLGCEVQQVFGMAEGLLNFTRPGDPDEVLIGTQGRPMSPADEIRIVDGELYTRGPYTLRGYYRAGEHNARSFTSDGFYRTGDLVRWGPGGNLVVSGRVKDVINRGGDKVPVEEVENHLLAHPSVHDAAVVGVPDPMMGERTCVYVVPRGQAPTLRDLAAFLTSRGLAAFKLPDRLEVVESLPGTGLGKVDRKALAARAASQ